MKASKAAAPRSGAIAEAWQREPPRIALAPDPLRGAPVVDTDRIKLSGTATSQTSVDPGASRLRDVFVYVNEQKVFFKVVPDEANASKLEFQTDLPLKPGNNIVTVFAREDEEFQARRSIVVYRRPPAEMAADAASRKQGAQAQ